MKNNNRSNFDNPPSRRGTRSYKWDTATDDKVLPMWVADMDFPAPQSVIDALIKRAKHGIFGYTKVPDEYYDAIINWFYKRHNFYFNKNDILYTTGVVPALSAVIKALTKESDKGIVQTPVYNCFFSSITNNKRPIVYNNLIYKEGRYKIDFEGLEALTQDPSVKLLLLCNPHNPVGRVWTIHELKTIGDICFKNKVIVVSDEIHCDLVYQGVTHIPFASISNDFFRTAVTLTAPSKTFNLAGLQVANIIVHNKILQAKIHSALNINEVCEINCFAIEALIAAYNEGKEWLEDVKIYLYENYLYLKKFFNEHFPELKIMPLEATYLVWIDIRALDIYTTKNINKILTYGKLWVNEGSIYGDDGDGFIRVNIACSRSTLKEGLKRFKYATEWQTQEKHQKQESLQHTS